MLKIKKQSNQRIKKKYYLGGIYMSATISNTGHLCQFLEAEVHKANKEGKMLSKEGLKKFVEDLTFSDKIKENTPLHELKNTTDPQGKIKLLANIYSEYVFSKKSTAQDDVKTAALNVLAEPIESKATLAKIKRALGKITGIPKALTKKLGELAQTLKRLIGRLADSLTKTTFLKRVKKLEEAVKSEDPSAIDDSLNKINESLQGLSSDDLLEAVKDLFEKEEAEKEENEILEAVKNLFEEKETEEKENIAKKFTDFLSNTIGQLRKTVTTFVSPEETSVAPTTKISVEETEA